MGKFDYFYDVALHGKKFRRVRKFMFEEIEYLFSHVRTETTQCSTYYFHLILATIKLNVPPSCDCSTCCMHVRIGTFFALQLLACHDMCWTWLIFGIASSSSIMHESKVKASTIERSSNLFFPHACYGNIVGRPNLRSYLLLPRYLGILLLLLLLLLRTYVRTSWIQYFD